VNKNLEKLSSGCRINCAGCDAGLAISEKMRIQISGLEQTQNNAKSGINLVQTAEGALTKVHDMLNRMYTLAEQSANGTYSGDVDRKQLQKEMESLRAEIDRIADATNYNGINLLDGSLTSAAGATVSPVEIGNKDQAHTGTADTVSFALHKEGVERMEPEFVVDLTDVEFTAKVNSSFDIKIGDQKFTVDKAKGGTTSFTADQKVNGNDLAEAIAALPQNNNDRWRLESGGTGKLPAVEKMKADGTRSAYGGKGTVDDIAAEEGLKANFKKDAAPDPNVKAGGPGVTDR